MVSSFRDMSSKRDDVHRKISELQKKIKDKEAEEKLATNDRQKEIKRNKIKQWKRDIEELADSLPGLREPKKKKRKAYIEDPDSD